MQPNFKMPHYMSEGGEKMQDANELRERMIQEFRQLQNAKNIISIGRES